MNKTPALLYRRGGRFKKMRTVRGFTFIFALLFFIRGEAQNLVPNPSFEDTLPNPNWGGAGLIQNIITDWYSPLPGSADYMSLIDPICPNCIASLQMPRTGNAYAGYYTFDTAVTNNRECVSVKLLDTLEGGKRYFVEFFVSRHEGLSYACGNMGAYFSASPITTSNGITNYTPQIENDFITEKLLNDTEWVKISGTFIAAGNEAYLNITNFTPDSILDTTFVGGGFSNHIATYYFIDDVSVVEYIDTLPEPPTEITLTPSPNDGTMQLKGNFPAGTKLEFFNALGQSVYYDEIPEGDQQQVISAPTLAAGIYIYVVSANGLRLKADRVVVIH